MERQPCNAGGRRSGAAISCAVAFAMTLLAGFGHAAEPPPDTRELPLAETGAATTLHRSGIEPSPRHLRCRDRSTILG